MTIAEPASKRATYADGIAVPPHLVAELLGGELVTNSRPAPRYAVASHTLRDELTGPYQKGRGGPGGWVFTSEPELHLGSNVVVPDLAGWRRETLPSLPETAWISTPPDWVCQVLSPATETVDRGVKRMFYAEAGVPFLWLLDPRNRLLETFALVERRWSLLATLRDTDEVSVPPFDAIAFSLGALWPFDSAL